jgi:hypothetical protein
VGRHGGAGGRGLSPLHRALQLQQVGSRVQAKRNKDKEEKGKCRHITFERDAIERGHELQNVRIYVLVYSGQHVIHFGFKNIRYTVDKHKIFFVDILLGKTQTGHPENTEPRSRGVNAS